MDRIKILVEKPSTRCEICHQSDLFSPQENICQRCSSIQIVRDHKIAIKNFYADNGYGKTIIEINYNRFHLGLSVLFYLIVAITIINYLFKYALGVSTVSTSIGLIVLCCLSILLINTLQKLKRPDKLLTCTDRGIIYHQVDRSTFIPWKRMKSISFEKDETETLVLHIHYDERYPISGVGKYSDTYYINISSEKGFKPSGRDLYEVVNSLFKTYH